MVTIPIKKVDSSATKHVISTIAQCRKQSKPTTAAARPSKVLFVLTNTNVFNLISQHNQAGNRQHQEQAYLCYLGSATDLMCVPSWSMIGNGPHPLTGVRVLYHLDDKHIKMDHYRRCAAMP